MIGTYCTQVKKFERGQMFRRYCVGCVHNTAHLGDAELHCRYLEYRHSSGAGRLPDKKPSVLIPPDMRGITLIEVLIIIAILGILAVVVVPKLLGY